jgi:hypothetical protein
MTSWRRSSLTSLPGSQCPMPENESARSRDDSESGSFGPLVGQKAHGCWIGYGSVLFLEFGEPRPLDDPHRHPSGEWSLWCDRILWRIEQGDRVLAGSEDARSTMENAIEELNGRTLLSGQISPTTGDSLLEFTDHLVLKTFVTTSEEDARWQFRRGDADFELLGPKIAESDQR